MSLYIPVVQSRYVIQGLFSEPKWQALVSSGVLETTTIEAAWGDRRVGDFVNVPQFVQVPDFARVDITSTSAATFTEVASNDAKAVIMRDFTPYRWFSHDRIRTGEDFERLASLTVGNKIAKRLIGQLHRTLQGSLAVSGVNHITDITPTGSNATNGALTVNAVRAAKSNLGDQGNQLKVMLIHSAVWFDLFYDLVTNYKYMANVSGEIIMDGMLPSIMGIDTIVISDDVTPVAGTGSDSGHSVYYTYLFRRSALPGSGATDGSIYFGYQRMPTVEQFIDSRVPSTMFQEKVSIDYVLQPKGFAWGGSSNPLDTDLSSSGNWSQANEDTRNIGVVAILSYGGAYATTA